MEQFTQEGDLKLFYTAVSADTLGAADIKIVPGTYELVRDPGLETAVMISLFSDARASDSDKLPGTFLTRSGFWGSVLLDQNMGSKLWLLSRSKINNETLRRAEQYCKEALKWMVDDGIAAKIEAVASINQTRYNQLDFLIVINRANVDNIFFKFFINWQYQIFGGLL